MGTTAITGTGITTDKVTVGGISIDKTDWYQRWEQDNH